MTSAAVARSARASAPSGPSRGPARPRWAPTALIAGLLGARSALMLDANQRWDVDTAIAWTLALAECRPLWIEEPTSCDDILGHATIQRAVAARGIGVATGEAASNRVVFKQLLQAGAIRYVQADSCRLGGLNEARTVGCGGADGAGADTRASQVLAVLLLARKFNVPVCPHAGGVGLCEHVNVRGARPGSAYRNARLTPTMRCWRPFAARRPQHLLLHLCQPAITTDDNDIIIIIIIITTTATLIVNTAHQRCSSSLPSVVVGGCGGSAAYCDV